MCYYQYSLLILYSIIQYAQLHVTYTYCLFGRQYQRGLFVNYYQGLRSVLLTFVTCLRVRRSYFGTYKGQGVKGTTQDYFKRYTWDIFVGGEQFLMTGRLLFRFQQLFRYSSNSKYMSKKDNLQVIWYIGVIPILQLHVFSLKNVGKRGKRTYKKQTYERTYLKLVQTTYY